MSTLHASSSSVDPRGAIVATALASLIVGECLGIATEQYRQQRSTPRVFVDAGPAIVSWVPDQPVGAGVCPVEEQ